MAKYAPHREAAVKFLEYLVSPEAQKIYAEANFEFPVRQGATIHPVIAALGPLKIDSVQLADIARHRVAASKLIDKVGFDN